MSERSLVCLLLILFASVVANASTDVLNYSATLAPDISAKSVTGSVLIRVSATSTAVEFDLW